MHRKTGKSRIYTAVFFLAADFCHARVRQTEKGAAQNHFKVDRLQIIVVAKNITVLQLFISRTPKMCAIPQLVSAPLNPIPTVEHFRRSHPLCEHSYGQHIYTSEENSVNEN